VEKHTNDSVPPKIYNFNPEESVTIDVVPPVEKYKGIQPIDIDSKYSLTEKNIVFVSDSKDSINNFYMHDRIDDIITEQKSCVYTYDSDQVSSTMYSDISQNISQNLMQKQQNTSSDSKDGDRYDKKLNQPNFKPSISNVFNSLNEYINAPTGSLNYVEPILTKVDNLSERSTDVIMEKDFRSNRNVTNNESIPMEKGINVIDKNVLDSKSILSTELNTFVKVEISNKQDNTIQNTSYHSTPVQSEENNSNAIPNSAISRYNNVTIDMKLSSSKDDIDKKVMINDTFKENSDNIINKQKQLDLDRRNPIDKYTFVENKESVVQSTKLDKDITSNENHDKNVETIKSDVFSSVCMTQTIDTSDDFSEEELNQYLLKLQEEERSKTENISLSDNTWLSQSYDELRSDREKNVSHCQQVVDQDVNEAPIFEKIMIGELPKVSQEEFQKTKKFPVIDYNTDIHNENIMDVKCNNTVKIDLNEKSNQLTDIQNNKLDKTIKDNHVTEAFDQDIAIQKNNLQAISDIIIQEKIISKFENIGEQLCSNNIIQKLQDSNRDTLLQDNNSDVLLNLSENKEDHDKRIYCQDIAENKNIFVIHETNTHDNVSKIETVSKISDTKENDQEAEKPIRPQTLNIVLTHDKNDSQTFGMLF